MAREFAKRFYRSHAWTDTRNAYLKAAGGICERCYRDRGLIVPGEIVHHIIPLTPDNINNAAISLSFDNLELVCRDCHAEIHDNIYEHMRMRRNRRYEIDENGRVTAADIPPSERKKRPRGDTGGEGRDLLSPSQL